LAGFEVTNEEQAAHFTKKRSSNNRVRRRLQLRSDFFKLSIHFVEIIGGHWARDYGTFRLLRGILTTSAMPVAPKQL
jgi:hypothetical protein